MIESFSGIVKFSRFIGSRSCVNLDSWIEIIEPQCANAIIEYVRTENSLLLQLSRPNIGMPSGFYTLRNMPVMLVFR